MKKLFLLFSIATLLTASPCVLGQTYPIYDGQQLADGLNMGVDTDQHISNWVSKVNGEQRMEYPPGQIWGAVFITVGAPKNYPRPFRNFSGFSTLSIEMRGERGGETLEIGIKDNTDPDNGQETKIPVTLTKEWQVYEFSLADFTTADLSHLYVVTEFVFGNRTGKTAYFRNIEYNR